ncbi:MBL fold metallo-hydrolase [Candidatus Bathyarchaeota archaeon]|nr:MBL fold metallo-hydrolase [Candidatus Bathyarchaeota archaeon]NIV67311.1 MBL fold metallo-hydrolase [Candidatus Bathyarchaeota archaeon]NIW16771.1 MBL fold metallo-hydrolase [Candidatus Bathyarchaeota archaeon]NIW33985.1 MBL fold metallo-hydrolase [Candidatus Bathyarchaeota archaeon]
MPADLYAKCPQGGSDKIEHYVTGLQACRQCGRVWRGQNKDLKLKILYDNEALEGFRKGHGFSCLVEEKKTLFDTGGDIETLLYNMRKIMVDPGKINRIVLSHEHGDHTGGIQILDHCGHVDVYVPTPFSSRLKSRLASFPNVSLKEISGPEQICQGVLTTGELGAHVKEQSLIVETDNSITLITGCAHLAWKI